MVSLTAEEESVRLAGGLMRAFAVHGILHVVPEFLDVAGEPLHIGNLLHVQKHRVMLQALVGRMRHSSPVSGSVQ